MTPSTQLTLLGLAPYGIHPALIWDLEHPERFFEIPINTAVWAMGKQKLALAEGNEVRIYDLLSPLKPEMSLETPMDAVIDLAWSHDNHYLVGIGSDFSMLVWDTKLDIMTTYENGLTDIVRLAWSNNDEKLAIVHGDWS
jgi:WD40 repeat protein